MKKRLWIGLILLCLLPAEYSYAVEGNELTITADKAVWDRKQGVTVLSGKVVVAKGKSSFTADMVEISGQMEKIKALKGTGNIHFSDLERNITMTADRIELSDWEKQITASGKVKITRGETIADADTIVYYQSQQRVVLTGGATVSQPGGNISGKKIVYHLQEERLEVIEGVRAWWKW
ncbi:LPS export ABC transporter periplasmic protein LptC [Candidatus Desantisbacteria bacterium]|nr:LPS export ABC transporter periplasmic protein LptC [Candidatus Desantisbacteria bacterium]